MGQEIIKSAAEGELYTHLERALDTSGRQHLKWKK